MARETLDADAAGRPRRTDQHISGQARRPASLTLWTGTIAGTALLMSVLLLGWMPAGGRVAAAATFDRQVLEQRAEAAIARWRPDQDEFEDQPANGDNAEPVSIYDGLYAGTATTKAAMHVVTFRIKVANGVGTGMQSRLDCGVAPLSLRISPSGRVSGIALIFGATCLKTELAIRGQAVGGVLLLRLGSQHLELAKLAE
jgi:hypothetical protein